MKIHSVHKSGWDSIKSQEQLHCTQWRPAYQTISNIEREKLLYMQELLCMQGAVEQDLQDLHINSVPAFTT